MSSEQKPRKQRGKVDRSAMFPVAPARHDAPDGYAAVLGEFKERIRRERLRVVLASNAVMVLLYWDIGERILDKQHHEGWGARVIDRLSADLQEAFPDMKGFSPRNLKYMRRFAEVWPEREIVQAVLAQLTWYHNIALLEKLPDADQRLWYARQTLQHGWSRNILALQIEARAIDRLAHDLKEAFPDMRGFSTRNLKYMAYFAEHCPEGLIGQQPAAQLPWFHVVTLLTKLIDPAEREWYAAQTVQHGWSRTTLEVHIKNRLRHRQGSAISNFAVRLPSPHSDLAHETLKDPYLFDFLGLGEDAHERDIENALIRHITRFLLEMGAGFAFVGRQFRLDVGGDEFFIDLLFYHTRLKCYVVVELKATAFKPEHVGQLNFYLAAVDAQIKAADDKPTIGLLLCKKQNRLVAQYALSGIDKPIGVAEYQLLRELPETLVSSLPSIDEIEAEFGDEMEGIDEE